MAIWTPILDNDAEKWCSLAHRLGRETFLPTAQIHDEDQTYPEENVQQMVATGLSGLFVPIEYGGQGQNLQTTAAVLEAVAQYCPSTAAVLSVYQLGAYPILLAGTEAQKKLVLGGLSKGDATSFALSEEAAGSDAGGIQATATRQGEGWRVRGEKWWIGNGKVAKHYVVFAKVGGTSGSKGITAFLVHADQPGVAVTTVCDKMGLRAARTTNLIIDTVVPDDAVVGKVGQGMSLAGTTLNVGRLLIAAQAIGLSIAAYESAGGWAVTREAFGRKIIEHQATGFKLADMCTEISAARTMLYQATREYDMGKSIDCMAAMIKLFASEMSNRTVNSALQVWGARGYCKPNRVERLYRDQRIIEVYEGSSEVQRMMITRMIGREFSRMNEERGIEAAVATY